MNTRDQVLERLISSIDRLTAAVSSAQLSAPPAVERRSIAAPDFAERLFSALPNRWVSVSEVRDALDMDDSAKAIGMMLVQSGCARKRVADGVRYFVPADASARGDASSRPPGAPAKLPEGIEERVAWYFDSKYCNPPHTPLQFLNQHFSGGRWKKTHEDEMHRRWPGKFALLNLREGPKK